MQTEKPRDQADKVKPPQQKKLQPGAKTTSGTTKEIETNITDDNPQASFKDQGAFKELRKKYVHDRAHDNQVPDSDDFLAPLREKYSHQPTFLQAVNEMANSLMPLFNDKKKGEFYKRAFLVIAEPERTISFRVNWTDDAGNLQTNRGWRVEFSSVLGPFKGGLRFHPSVDEGVLKFLGFEQIFKNALTGLQIGGGKGGSDFDPKGKSDAEVRRFCTAFMTELRRYLHPHIDVPAGDIGVGERELGYLYGQYKKLTKRSDGVLTGKPLILGGSDFRPEATGFGVAYIAKIAIEKDGGTLNGARCAVSGSGNVAQYAAMKLLEFGAKVISLSDSNGSMVFNDGMTGKSWQALVEAKQVRRARLSSLAASQSGGTYIANHSPWKIRDFQLDYAFPCATENEINCTAATRLIKNGLKGIFEGANLPTSLSAQQVLRENNIMYIPGKAANAGGVAVSGFEMAQNAQRLSWEGSDVDDKLREKMIEIHNDIEEVSKSCSCTFEEAANRSGFLRLVEAMQCLGWIW